MHMDEITKAEEEVQQAETDSDADTPDENETTALALSRDGKKEKKELDKRYFHPFIREADAKFAKIPGVKGFHRGEASAMVRAIMRGAERMERSALMEVLFLYSFAGLKVQQIAARMAIDQRMIRRVMVDPRYAQGYDIFKRDLMGKISDAMTMRVQETMIDALELKIRLMRKAKSEWLRNQIANEILAMGQEIVAGTGKGLSDQTTAIWQRMMKRVMPDGTKVTETQTLTKALPEEKA